MAGVGNWRIGGVGNWSMLRGGVRRWDGGVSGVELWVERDVCILGHRVGGGYSRIFFDCSYDS